MKPIFTVHAGEFLAAEEIERHFPHLDVWLPTRDVGVDLLVTDPAAEGKVAFQVKYSKDYRVTHFAAELQSDLRACGWWTLTRSKIEKSPADYWVFVLYGLARGSVDYAVIPTRELLQRLTRIHGKKSRYQTYIWTTQADRCWETRGLKEADQALIATGDFRSEPRDFSSYLANWSCLHAFRAAPQPAELMPLVGGDGYRIDKSWLVKQLAKNDPDWSHEIGSFAVDFRDGDELWLFDEPAPPDVNAGAMGVALVRDGEPIATIITGIH